MTKKFKFGGLCNAKWTETKDEKLPKNKVVLQFLPGKKLEMT